MPKAITPVLTLLLSFSELTKPSTQMDHVCFPLKCADLDSDRGRSKSMTALWVQKTRRVRRRDFPPLLGLRDAPPRCAGRFLHVLEKAGNGPREDQSGTAEGRKGRCGRTTHRLLTSFLLFQHILNLIPSAFLPTAHHRAIFAWDATSLKWSPFRSGRWQSFSTVRFYRRGYRSTTAVPSRNWVWSGVS